MSALTLTHLLLFNHLNVIGNLEESQPRPQGLLLIQNVGTEKPLAKVAKMAPKIREDIVT